MKKILFETPDALASGAAALFVKTAQAALSARGVFRVALSGGTTPKALFEKLAAAPYLASVDWPRVQLFWGDERWVPLDDARSNYLMTKQTLLDRVPLRAETIFPVPFLETPEASAQAYEATLREVFEGLPCFDLVFLGLGTDGHTASLFPNTPVLQEKDLWAAPVFPKGLEPRVSLTYPVLNNAREVCFLVAGESKARVVKEILDGHGTAPAAAICPTHGSLAWYLDQAAFSLIPDP